MAEVLKANERLECIGHSALRAPDGTFLPAVPLYIKVDESQVDEETGLTKGEAELCNDIAGILVAKYKQYMNGVREIEKGASATDHSAAPFEDGK